MTQRKSTRLKLPIRYANLFAWVSAARSPKTPGRRLSRRLRAVINPDLSVSVNYYSRTIAEVRSGDIVEFKKARPSQPYTFSKLFGVKVRHVRKNVYGLMFEWPLRRWNYNSNYKHSPGYDMVFDEKKFLAKAELLRDGLLVNIKTKKVLSPHQSLDRVKMYDVVPDRQAAWLERLTEMRTTLKVACQMIQPVGNPRWQESGPVMREAFFGGGLHDLAQIIVDRAKIQPIRVQDFNKRDRWGNPEWVAQPLLKTALIYYSRMVSANRDALRLQFGALKRL